MAAAFALAALCGPAIAEDGEDDEPSILDSVPALSDLKAGRDALADKGFVVSGFYFADLRANLRGGLDEGSTFSGLFKIGVDVDGEKVFGIEGGRLHADMLQIHGRDVSEVKVGNVLSANDIGAVPTTRLFELYWEQKAGERWTFKVGQLAADEEFFKSGYGEDFIGATFGWAAPPSENLPQGGPAYPLAALAVQAAFEATENLTLVGAVYNGYTAKPGAFDPERANRHGLAFRLGDAPLVILEGRYTYKAGDLPGELKLGGYAHFGRFDDLKYGTDGLVLGSPGSNDEPRRRNDNFNLYAVLDQQVWRADDGEANVGVFLRGVAGPADRNPIDLYVDGGFVATGLVPGRPNDIFAIAAAYANFSPRLADAEAAEYAAAGERGATSRFEAVIEATYRAELVPGLTLRPTLQYVMRPNGGPPEDGGRRIPNATIFGVTTVVTF